MRYGGSDFKPAKIDVIFYGGKECENSKCCGGRVFKGQGFYHALIEGMEDAEFEIGWKKDIYPSIEFFKDSIAGVLL